MTARFWSWPASEPAKSRTLTAALAPRIVEASIAIGRLRQWHSRTRWREKLMLTTELLEQIRFGFPVHKRPPDPSG
jgi:hypothetical protein